VLFGRRRKREKTKHICALVPALCHTTENHQFMDQKRQFPEPNAAQMKVVETHV
jgi:hypothetical protein